MIKACLGAALLWMTSLTTVLADSSMVVPLISGTIGPVNVRIPLVNGLMVDTVDPDLALHIVSAASKDAAETTQTLRSMAETADGLKLRTISLTARAVCKAGVDLPICKFSQFSRDAASVAWIEIIHRPDMAVAFKTLDLEKSREVLTVKLHAGTLPVVLLQKTLRHPYGCPDDKEFGSCRMYMQVGANLLAVMMFWRNDDDSSLTPFDQMADAMAVTIKELVSD